MKVLVVNDVRTSRILASRILERVGYKVKAVECGVEAIDRLRLEHFDIVLMDIQMPDMSGIEAATIIRSNICNIHCREIPILAFSSGTDHTSVDFEKAGINGCIVKPINIHRLMKTIEQYKTR